MRDKLELSFKPKTTNKMKYRKEEDLAINSIYSTGMTMDGPDARDANNPYSTVERLMNNYERSKANKAALDE